MCGTPIPTRDTYVVPLSFVRFSPFLSQGIFQRPMRRRLYGSTFVEGAGNENGILWGVCAAELHPSPLVGTTVFLRISSARHSHTSVLTRTVYNIDYDFPISFDITEKLSTEVNSFSGASIPTPLVSPFAGTSCDTSMSAATPHTALVGATLFFVLRGTSTFVE